MIGQFASSRQLEANHVATRSLGKHFTHGMEEFGGLDVPDKFSLLLRTYPDPTVAWLMLSHSSLLIAHCLDEMSSY